MSGQAEIGEALIARLWQAQRFARDDLRTVDGEPLQVVYPGRRRAPPGPDFQGALLAFGGAKLRHGGVEIHLRSSDWARHGHDRDPAYDGTLLQVVLRHDARQPIRRADGTPVPTLALADYLAGSLDALAAELPADLLEWPLAEQGPCAPDPEAVVARLEAAGLERFAARRLTYVQALEKVSVADLFWAGLIEAMGYGVNREPARALARRLPYTGLVERAAAQPAAQRAETLQALLLGAAGLLPSQRGRAADGPVPVALEAAWRAWRAAVPADSPPLAWRFAGVRPASYPTRRLAGLALLLAERGPGKLVAEAACTLRTWQPRAAAGALADMLVVPAEDDYWRHHWDFGAASARPLPALLGADRAALIVVNVLLPLLAAWADVLEDSALAQAAEACYRQHPATGDNERLRHMRRQVLGSAARGVANTACRQQGLLHIYAQTCDWRRCGECAVGPATRETPRVVAPPSRRPAARGGRRGSEAKQQR